MNNSNIFNSLRIEANKSLIDQQLAAAIIKGKKMISKPCCNTIRGICRGNCVGSLHAEANAIINYYGRELSFDKKNGWILDVPLSNRHGTGYVYSSKFTTDEEAKKEFDQWLRKTYNVGLGSDRVIKFSSGQIWYRRSVIAIAIKIWLVIRVS